MTEVTNHDAARPAVAQLLEPDPHGVAALLLVESLLHGLIVNSVVSVPGAIEIVEVAEEVEAELAAESGAHPDAIRQSRDLLVAISSSLKYDV